MRLCPHLLAACGYRHEGDVVQAEDLDAEEEIVPGSPQLWLLVTTTCDAPGGGNVRERVSPSIVAVIVVVARRVAILGEALGCHDAGSLHSRCPNVPVSNWKD